MRRRNLFIMAALCVTLALSGCRSNKLGDSGDTGTQNGNTGTQNESAGTQNESAGTQRGNTVDTEEDFGLEKLQISGEELQDTTVTRGTALMKYQSGYL